MKKPLLLILAGGLLAMYSCSDKNTKPEDTATETSTPASTSQELVPTESTPIESGTSEQTISTVPQGSQPMPTPVPGTTSAKTGDQGPLNPAHGEPGHRCEIAVGAPLSSAPTGASPTTTPAGASPTITPSGASPTITPSGPTQLPNAQQGSVTQPVQFQTGPAGSAPTTITTAPSATPGGAPTTVTAPGMNPPHGQPGHDCAVAVGAPLKK